MGQNAMSVPCIIWIIIVCIIIIGSNIYYDYYSNKKPSKHKKDALTKRLEDNWDECQKIIDKHTAIHDIENELNKLFKTYNHEI